LGSHNDSFDYVGNHLVDRFSFRSLSREAIEVKSVQHPFTISFGLNSASPI